MKFVECAEPVLRLFFGGFGGIFFGWYYEILLWVSVIQQLVSTARWADG